MDDATTLVHTSIDSPPPPPTGHEAAPPTRLADYQSYFNVPSPFYLDHQYFSPEKCGELCHCAPSTPEEEYLLGTGLRAEQIKQFLATKGQSIEMCGPCNELTFAASDNDKRQFWAEHPDCQWPSYKDYY